MDKKQSVGAAWVKTSKNGNEFLSLTIGDKRYTLFKNDRKSDPKQPDWRVFEDTWTPEKRNVEVKSKPEGYPEEKPVYSQDQSLPF